MSMSYESSTDSYQMLQQWGSKVRAECPGFLSSWRQMCKDACSEVADLHLWAVQQSADVVQEPLHHQLYMQLPDLCDVVLHNNRWKGNNDVLIL